MFGNFGKKPMISKNIFPKYGAATKLLVVRRCEEWDFVEARCWNRHFVIRVFSLNKIQRCTSECNSRSECVFTPS